METAKSIRKKKISIVEEYSLVTNTFRPMSGSCHSSLVDFVANFVPRSTLVSWRELCSAGKTSPTIFCCSGRFRLLGHYPLRVAVSDYWPSNSQWWIKRYNLANCLLSNSISKSLWHSLLRSSARLVAYRLNPFISPHLYHLISLSLSLYPHLSLSPSLSILPSALLHTVLTPCSYPDSLPESAPAPASVELAELSCELRQARTFFVCVRRLRRRSLQHRIGYGEMR